MEISSIVFGKVEVDPSSVVQFARGMFGLESLTEYVLLQPDPSLPFRFLQSKQNPDVCLMLADPFVFHPSYEFDLGESDLKALGDPTPDQLQIWVTVTSHEVMERSTINLLAPIVLHVENKLALQIVLHDSGYSSRTPILPAKEGE